MAACSSTASSKSDILLSRACSRTGRLTGATSKMDRSLCNISRDFVAESALLRRYFLKPRGAISWLAEVPVSLLRVQARTRSRQTFARLIFLAAPHVFLLDE